MPSLKSLIIIFNNVFAFVLLIIICWQIYFVISKRKPIGPDAMGWSLVVINLFINAFVFFVVLILLVLNYHATALIIEIILLLVLCFKNLGSIIISFYHNFLMSFVNSKPIQIRLDNRTNNQIKIKFDFMVDHFSKHSSLIIESFETTIEPNAVRFFDLSKHQTHLVKFRVKEITISFFKQKFIKESDYQFWIDIQPCYYSITEKREAFSNGNYGVSIIS